MIDRAGLAEFLRSRREALQPEDVGLPRGPRRRTSGLRREEVAALCHMSTDYYSRLERECGPQPSSQMLASIAQGLHLSLDERDHLFRLAGQNPPARGGGGTNEHISPGLLRVLDRLADTPAARDRYAPQEHPFLTRMYASGLRQIVTLRGPDSRAAHLADLLLASSAEFRQVWDTHEIGIRPHDVKHFIHPQVGALELTCQQLVDPGQAHSLLVYTAVPGSESHDKLHLLSVIGAQPLG
jgi:transcriptional regulator with XRE-family HTH domain